MKVQDLINKLQEINGEDANIFFDVAKFGINKEPQIKGVAFDRVYQDKDLLMRIRFRELR